MQEKVHLLILTPYGRYFEGDVDFLEVRSEKYGLGILPNHAPLISTVDICKMTIRMMGKDNYYAVGGGIIHVEKDQVNLILSSVERADEIDVERAKQAKQRAEERLKTPSNDDVDVSRAKLALLRATNRLKLVSKD